MKQDTTLVRDDVVPPEGLLLPDGLHENKILDRLAEAVLVCDQQGRITFFNEAAVRIWGRRPNRNEEAAQFRNAYKIWINGELIASDQFPAETVLRTGRPLKDVDAFVERPDGSRFHATFNIDPIIDSHGTLTGTINIFSDTSAIRTAENALRDAEARQRQILERVDVPLYIMDAQGAITFCNRRAADLWGRMPEAGKEHWSGAWKLLDENGKPFPPEQSPSARCLREGRMLTEQLVTIEQPNGDIRHLKESPTPFFDSSARLVGAFNILSDITGQADLGNERKGETNEVLNVNFRKKQSDALEKGDRLKESEERYHKMIEEVEDYAIILLDRQGFIQNWNKGAEKIKGYREDEIVGRNFSVFYLPEDRARGLHTSLIQLAARTGKAIHEGWRRRKDGTAFWGSIVLTALHDRYNNVIGFSKVTRDLTERKIAEDKMREYTSQLEFQNKELEQFAYAASHDMKEPLRKIHFYNSVIAENVGDILDVKSREYLNRSISAVKRMSDLIEDLLTYSKTTSNIESFEDVDMNEVLVGIELLHKEEFEQKKVRIESDRLPVVRGIMFQLQQLMFNLINNSIKYKHPERDVLIRLTARMVPPTEIREKGVEMDKMYHKISIIDNGVGFEPQYAEKIFEIFQRLNNLPGTRGSGIGLAICKKIVQNHKGFIRATGRLNEGARFDLYIPAE